MRAIQPGRPPAKLQAICTAHWDSLRLIAYISGNALIILGGPQKVLQTIYVDDAGDLEAVTIEESSGRIAVCGAQHVYIFAPIGRDESAPRWSRLLDLHCDGDHVISTLSWGSPEELLVGSSNLTLWYLPDSENASKIWVQKLANPVKLAQFSYDAGLIASTGQYDQLVKIWRRLSYGSDDVKFDVSYLAHPATLTNMHWRKPWHAEQNLDNLLYTVCADNKIRIWAPSDAHSLTILQLWGEIDMTASIQPRNYPSEPQEERRYTFIVDSRDFSVATEKAVRNGPANGFDHALEHLIEVATRSPEICVVLDGRGHMSAWGLENAGCKNKKLPLVFNVAHVEGFNIYFGPESNSDEDYAQFCTFSGGVSDSSLSILVHYYDGRINWFDTQITELFDTAPSPNRVHFKASWSGHNRQIKKIIRSVSGSTIMSRTDDNHVIVWSQKTSNRGPVLNRQSSLDTEVYIRRSCVVDHGRFAALLHHGSISLWDTKSLKAKRLATAEFSLPGKPLCILQLPAAEKSDKVHIAAICGELDGMVWEIDMALSAEHRNMQNGDIPLIRQFSEFKIGPSEDILFVLPVDPAGARLVSSDFLDIFAPDIALSLSSDGTLRMMTAKVDMALQKVHWLVTSVVETGISNPSLVSGSSIRKAAVTDHARTSLTIWDTSSAQLEFEECYSNNEFIQDLDWTSTPDDQSILAVGFPHRVVLLSQLRYDYLNSGPAWGAIREIRIGDLTPHPIGDSCWLADGNLAVGTGNQIFVYDRDTEVSGPLLAELRMPSSRTPSMDLFQVVRRLNGCLPFFHPQFIGQCILSGKNDFVHKILIALHRKLKFWSEGDELESFLDLPIEDFIAGFDVNVSKAVSKEMRSSFADFSIEEEEQFVTEDLATRLNENLARTTLPQISSRQQFYLADIIECVAAVEKHRRSMDDNAARYLLFFRQHMLRKGQAPDRRLTISWREIVFAFHSVSQDILVDLVSRTSKGKMLWEHTRESGMLMWVSDVNALRTQLEIIARNEYTKTDEKSPVDCSLFYLALKKKSVLQGLWRMASWNREQASTIRLLANNFNEPRWKTSAMKNAYALLSKRRFEYAAAFFLLAGALGDAVNVCANQLNDMQLAVTIARAYEGDDGPVLRDFITNKILPEAAETGNRWMATWAFWMLGKRDKAVRTLISPIYTLLGDSPASPGSPGQNIPLQARSYLSNDPALVVLYRQLREKTTQTLKGASMINPREEWDFVMRNARLYSRMGCDLLALDLTRNWEFLMPPPPQPKRLSIESPRLTTDPRRLLRRRSSMVVDDMPSSILGLPRMAPVSSPFRGFGSEDPFATSNAAHKATAGAKKPPPTVFEEPDASSLLDSFGF